MEGLLGHNSTFPSVDLVEVQGEAVEGGEAVLHRQQALADDGPRLLLLQTPCAHSLFQAHGFHDYSVIIEIAFEFRPFLQLHRDRSHVLSCRRSVGNWPSAH